MLLIAVGRLLQFVILLLTLRLATGLLSPAEMGKATIVTATISFFALLLLNPVGMFMNRRLHAWASAGQARHYLYYVWVFLLIVAACAALSLVTVSWLEIWLPSMRFEWFLVLVCGNLIFTTQAQVVATGLNLFGHRGWFSVLTVVAAGLGLILAVLLVHWFGPHAEYWLTGLLLGQLLVGVIGMPVFYGKLRPDCPQSKQQARLSHVHYRVLFNFAWPVALAAVLGWVQSQGYRYLMESRLGLADLGLFVAGFGISAGLISGFESIFTAYFQPGFYRRISDSKAEEQSAAWLEYAQNILPALLLTSLFIIAAAPELTRLMLGPSFSQSGRFVIWGACAELARISAGVFALAAHAKMDTRQLLLPNLVGAISALMLLGWAITAYGSDGVGLGLMLSSLLMLLVSIYVTRKRLAIPLPVRGLLRSMFLGVGLLAIAMATRAWFGAGSGIYGTLAQMCALSIPFALFQYQLLLPALKREAFQPVSADRG